MKQYVVRITDSALADMEEIYNYIAIQLQAPENAMGQYNRIAETIEGLNVFPERVKLVESEPERIMGLRQLVIDNYSVFYVIEDMDVIVTRVLYSAMDISRRLLEDNGHIQ
ncbi:type II toxin-antitoxin system RelE/ParE family toxin [Bacteroides acidifaciens]|uniref:type II toxin-antitoxin system RelE/ParE family toxin n=1 Tax=Bacteroides acidifaciens TaxID=85831 RepID=UPI0025791297|nr:type II toxin-antitoxin system RelE/ParE family toxin [Bacteroides acidifaciens]